MEILNSGSFIPLDNREKIEQLIFTATTLATEASRTEGFRSSGPANYQLGLEMWKGAEYMCRAHEEVTIKNLFLSKFLERLREIEKHSADQPRHVESKVATPSTVVSMGQDQITAVTPPSIQADPISTPPVPLQEIVLDSEPREARDEYLGVVSQTLDTESGGSSYADECRPEFERDFADADNVSEAVEDITVVAAESIEGEREQMIASDPPQPDEPSASATNEPDVFATRKDNQPAGEEPCADEAHTSAIVSGVEPIVLTEKEPYAFDACTLTAVIQLLPEVDRIRKCVLSIRSHDFAPQIDISEVNNGDFNEGVIRYLGMALEQYRTSLPALAAEKLKRQKPTGKTRSSKTHNQGAKQAPISVDSNDPTPPTIDKNSEAGRDQQSLFAS